MTKYVKINCFIIILSLMSLTSCFINASSLNSNSDLSNNPSESSLISQESNFGSSNSDSDEFDFNKSYSDEELMTFLGQADKYTYNPRFTYMSNAWELYYIGVTSYYGFPYKEKNVYFTRPRYPSSEIAEFEITDTNYLTISKAQSLGLFGEKINKKVSIFNGINGYDIHWESFDSYKEEEISLDLLKLFGMWNCPIVLFNEKCIDIRDVNRKIIFNLGAFPGFPIYSDDLSDVVGVCVYDSKVEKFLSYMKEDGYGEFGTLDIIKTKLRNGFFNKESFGPSGFYLDPRTYTYVDKDLLMRLSDYYSNLDYFEIYK